MPFRFAVGMVSRTFHCCPALDVGGGLAYEFLIGLG